MRVVVEGLTVSRGGTTVLSGVDLAAEPGAILGVVGPNGAGKTTLLQTVNGSLSPTRGAVRVGGASVHALSSREASRRVATLPQAAALDFEFTVREVVEMGRFPHAGRVGADPDPDAVARALSVTDTAELADRRVTSLSGGERQRVLVARVVAQDAPVVLLDEPTASLDLRHQLRTLRLARDLADAGRTVVAAIHDLDLAARFCDEVAVLADGDCVTTGPPAAVLSPDTVERAFDVSATVRTDPVTGSPIVTATPAREDPAGEVHVVGGGAAAASLCYPLRAAGFEVSVGPVPPGDRAVEVVGALDGDVITAPAFRSLDEETLAALDDWIERADATVVAAGGVDPGRRPALQAASEADRLVVVADRDSGRRDPADEEGRRCLRRLRRRGRVVDADAVPDAVAALVEGAPVAAPDD